MEGHRQHPRATVRLAAAPAERDAAFALRVAVFCGEQGVSHTAELDGRDDQALQIVAVEPAGAEPGRGAVIGTCRLLGDGEIVSVGRVAVRADRRRHGIGTLLLAEAERQARAIGAAAIELHAQLRSEAFYLRAGYRSYGDRFLEEGIEHVAMRRDL